MARAGDILAGKYRLIDKIGHGGMGTVFEAEHVAIEKRVAVKVLHRRLTGNPVAVARLTGEARAAAATGHPGVVEVYDLETADSGDTFIVMELLSGRSLSSIVREDGPVRIRFAVEVACRILTALEAVHRKGILHRDIKPSNIVVDERADDGPAVKLLDFGVAKMMDASGAALTRPGSTVGTPAYMAPEQARGERDLDERADLWAVGVLLFVSLTGEKPFRKAALGALSEESTHGEMIRPRELRSEIPEGLERILLRALQPKRSDRYRSAAEMLEALSAYAEEGAPARWTRPPAAEDEWEAPVTADRTAPDLLGGRPSRLPTIRSGPPAATQVAEEEPEEEEPEPRRSEPPTVESGPIKRPEAAEVAEQPSEPPEKAPAAKKRSESPTLQGQPIRSRPPAQEEPESAEAGGDASEEEPEPRPPEAPTSKWRKGGRRGEKAPPQKAAEAEAAEQTEAAAEAETEAPPAESPAADVAPEPEDMPPSGRGEAKPRRLELLVGTLVVGVAAIVALLVAGYDLLDTGARSTIPSNERLAGPLLDREGARSEPATIRLSISADRPDARVRIDDGPLQRLPLDATPPGDGRRHGVVVVADGFLPAARFVVFDRDLDMRFVLEPDEGSATGDAGRGDSGTSEQE